MSAPLDTPSGETRLRVSSLRPDVVGVHIRSHFALTDRASPKASVWPVAACDDEALRARACAGHILTTEDAERFCAMETAGVYLTADDWNRPSPAFDDAEFEREIQEAAERMAFEDMLRRRRADEALPFDLDMPSIRSDVGTAAMVVAILAALVLLGALGIVTSVRDVIAIGGAL